MNTKWYRYHVETQCIASLQKPGRNPKSLTSREDFNKIKKMKKLNVKWKPESTIKTGQDLQSRKSRENFSK
jgi:hypothetical protein